MVTSKQCFAKWGDPTIASNEAKYMVMWDIPTELEHGVIPKRLYCNKALIAPLSQALKNVIDRGLIDEIKTWDGCFNVRRKRGATSQSLHSWGIAVDINAAWNQFGKQGNMSPHLAQCFIDAGFTWGATWSTPDFMHFQLAQI